MGSTIQSIEYLAAMGTIECNYSFGDAPRFKLDHWLSHQAMIDNLRQLPIKSFGNVYVRYPEL
jgi:hypothetical protein